MQPLTTGHCGSVQYITIGDSRLLTAAGLTRSPLYLIGDAASRCGLSRVGYFIPLNGRRPLNGHPPSVYIKPTTGPPCFLEQLVAGTVAAFCCIFLELVARRRKGDLCVHAASKNCLRSKNTSCSESRMYMRTVASYRGSEYACVHSRRVDMFWTFVIFD